MIKKIILLFLFFCFLFADDMLLDFEKEYQTKTINDPLIKYNKFMTKVNDKIYTYVLIPVTEGYHKVMPKPLRGAFSNFFYNLAFPVRFVNDILQAKFKKSILDTKRFLINSTLGFAGFSDSASLHYGLDRVSEEDFGQTLGKYGFKDGFYIVLPIFGPSNLRDSIGMIGDFFLTPTNYIFPHSEYENRGLKAFEYINIKNPIEYKQIKKDSLNLYIFLRNAYKQQRDYLIKE